ncbi:hypothetical protein RJ55_06992 [Drechmeria coniospora]|nr:hypothetical protein RJ55_06992 [Drechmeria coniospora]
MTRLPLPLYLLVLAVLAPSPVHASPASNLTLRSATCASAGRQSCPKDVTDKFCCPSGSSCIGLAGNTTVLCCPGNSSCRKIQPITCNIRKQDPEQNSEAPIQTTVFDVDLEKCGNDLCCPFGFSCAVSGKECTMDLDQTKLPASKTGKSDADATTSTATGSTTGSAMASATGSATGTFSSVTPTIPSQDVDGSKSSSDKSSIIGGTVGGSLGLLLIVSIAFFCIRRRRRATESERNISPLAHGAVISAPVVHPDSYRSDFLHRSPTAQRPFSPEPQTPPQTRHHSVAPRISIPNPFDSRSLSAYSHAASVSSSSSLEECSARTGHVVGAHLDPIRALEPSEMRHSHRLSTQDIQHEAHGKSYGIAAESTTTNSNPYRLTTLTDLLEHARFEDSRTGKPYVPGVTPVI